MYLALYGVSMNFYLNAYQKYLNDIVQKINNIIKIETDMGLSR